MDELKEEWQKYKHSKLGVNCTSSEEVQVCFNNFVLIKLHELGEKNEKV